MKEWDIVGAQSVEALKVVLNEIEVKGGVVKQILQGWNNTVAWVIYSKPMVGENATQQKR